MFMEEELGKDIVDGKIVDFSKMSIEELREMKEKLKKQEKAILDKINKELEQDDDELGL